MSKPAGRFCLAAEHYEFKYMVRDKDKSTRADVLFDPKETKDMEPSKVSYQGSLQEKKELRTSWSLRNQFVVHKLPPRLSVYFEKVKIGFGSKHVYEKGHFMKEHLDSRQPDIEEGYPHIMTLVVCTSIDEMKVNGQKPSLINPSGGRDPTFAVLFSLDCPHEITPIASDEARVSFSFPVYGVLNPFFNLRSSSSPSDLYELVAENISKINPFSYELAEAQGMVDALNDTECSAIIYKLRTLNGEYPYHDNKDLEDIELKSFVQIQFNNPDPTTICTDSEYKIPCTATDIVIKPLETQVQLFEQLKARLKKLIQEKKDEYKEFSKTVVPAIDPSVQIDAQPFIVMLSGKYFKDDTEESLIPIDREVLTFLRNAGRTVTFLKNFNPDYWSELLLFYVYDKEARKFVSIDLSDKDDDHCQTLSHLPITDFTVEFNDEGGYDARFVRCYSIFKVF